MNLNKKFWLISLSGCFLVGIIVFFLSYHSSKEDFIKQASHTIQVVTNVKWQLLERKLSSLEQQLNLLAKNKILNSMLQARAEKNSTTNTSSEFDEYIKSLLYSQGCSNLLLIRQSGEVVYTNSTVRDKPIPAEVYSLAMERMDTQDSTVTAKIILNKNNPQVFYFCKGIGYSNGAFPGALIMEIPKEFLSIELHNTVQLDSLDSYLVSSLGTLNQVGMLKPDTCISCKWSKESFILFSPDKKIRETWTLLSVFPVSQIQARHILYESGLDGMIAFLAAGIVMLIIVYIQLVIQKSKGITNADILLVQTTWNAVSEYSIKIIAGFYKHLFGLAPEVRPMFKSDQATQEKRMALMINTIVNSADSLEEFKGSISQLAKKHVHMGVKREYFPIVVTAIIRSVEDQYGHGFTLAHRNAWYKILNRISTIMIEEMESYQRKSAKIEN